MKEADIQRISYRYPGTSYTYDAIRTSISKTSAISLATPIRIPTPVGLWDIPNNELI